MVVILAVLGSGVEVGSGAPMRLQAVAVGHTMGQFAVGVEPEVTGTGAGMSMAS